MRYYGELKWPNLLFLNTIVVELDGVRYEDYSGFRVVGQMYENYDCNDNHECVKAIDMTREVADWTNDTGYISNSHFRQIWREDAV